MIFTKENATSVFTPGDIVQSGASGRKNAAHLRILSIEDDGIHYRSLRNSNPGRHRYSYLQILLDGYDRLDPKSIQKSVNGVLKQAGFHPNYSTENYAYTLVKAFYECMLSPSFLTAGGWASPESLDNSDELFEGARQQILVERAERNPEARNKCIEHFGPTCQACAFDFEKKYGATGKGHIHVHHQHQLADSTGERKVDPTLDLIPLCPNCHSMIHQKRTMLTVSQLKQLIAGAIKQS